MEKNRRSDIDFYKGILIWLVVISHIMALSEFSSDSFVFKLIGNCHIPLFLMISGFLFSPEKFFRPSWIQRIILPWLIANFIYVLLPGASFSLRGLIVGFTTHLWYIPAIIIYMFIIFVAEKFCRGNIAWGVLLAFAILLQFSDLIVGDSYIVRASRFCISNFRLPFLIYFLIGYLTKKVSIEIRQLRLWIGVGLLFLVFASFEHGLNGIFRLTGNIMLMVPLLKTNIRIPTGNQVTIFLINSGRNSMFIYLWHVVPLILPLSISMKYICMLVWLIAMSNIISLRKRIPHAYLLGLS